jgi:N-acyl-D-amino-acid deacylase
MFETIILNGTIIDGSGDPRYTADIGLQNGIIRAIDQLDGVQANEVIDASGLIVAPGFIDCHVHSDLMLLGDPQHAPKLLQGVTTEVLGQDGLSYAPLSKDNLDLYVRYLAGLNGAPDIELDWSSVAEFRARFDRQVAINTAYLLPHGAFRLETLGMKDAPLVGSDLAKAQKMIDQGMCEGAVGFSTGLAYYPCVYSDTKELIELCRPVADHDGVFAPHLRSIFRGEPFDPVEEAIEISRQSGVALHFTHFGSNWDFAPIERAKDEGLDITFDAYPYFSGSSMTTALLPAWAHEGGPDKILERLRDATLREQMENEVAGIRVANRIPTWDDLMVSYVPSAANRDLQGLTFPEAAKVRGASSCEKFVCDILLEENLEVGHRMPPPSAEVWDQKDKEYMQLLIREDYAVSSDGILVGDMPHPRVYGTFPRVIGRLRRKFNTPLELLINRMTGFTAQRFKLNDRGLLRPGKAADIVIFDADLVNDTATYDAPKNFPVGIEHVLVNGEIAVKNSSPTGVLAGRAIP